MELGVEGKKKWNRGREEEKMERVSANERPKSLGIKGNFLKSHGTRFGGIMASYWLLA